VSGDFAGRDMERVQKTVEVDAPLRAVYNQWTQFEEFPRFMTGVKEVRRFESIEPLSTRVHLTMAYEPKGVVEHVGDALGIFGARVQSTVEEFKKFMEARGTETGSWRGRIHDSRPG